MAEDKTVKEEKVESKTESRKPADSANKKTAVEKKKAASKSTKTKAAKSKTSTAKPAQKKAAANKPEQATKQKPVATKTTEKTAATEKTVAEPKPAKPALRFEKEGDFGIIVFDTPDKPVNILSGETMQQLDKMLDEVVQKTEFKALLFMSAKDGNFIAGADIDAIKNITTVAEGETAAKEGQRIYNKIAGLPFPTIAVIDGSCMGGGLELALACKYRIARQSQKTKIGLPEVRLGILPAWGGSQRLPRLIGIQKALDYILTGRTVDARKAFRDGIVDSIIPEDYPADYTREAALRFAGEILLQARRDRIRQRREKSNLQKILLEKNALGRKILFDQAKKKTRATTKDHYPAPLKALSAVEQGINLTIEEGLAIEAKLLGECIVTDVSKNLLKVFQMTEELKKDKGAENFEGESQQFDRIGVLGAGTMGGGIAQLAAYYEKPVRMKDINLQAIGAGMSQASKTLSDAVKRRRMKKSEAEHKLSLISGATDYSGFEKTDLVIEAIVEDLEIKKKVFAEIDKIVPTHCVIASNTSSLPVTEMAKATKRPEKVAGLHFFNPVHKMPLVEVIRGEKSSDETIVSLVDFSRAIGKTPIVVKDSPGFLVNRILSPYMNEAALLLLEGQNIEHIDRAITSFGMPMGPLNLFDEVGIDVTHKVSKILEKAFEDKMQASPVIAKMVENNRFGKKNGKGFYIYRGKQKQADPAVYSLLGDLRKESTPLALGIIQERSVLLMINEAARCLEEEIVRHPRDVDIGMIFGTGFPPFRGGLLHYADTIGSERLKNNLESYAEKYGDRFAPAQLIVDMAKKGERFFG